MEVDQRSRRSSQMFYHLKHLLDRDIGFASSLTDASACMLPRRAGRMASSLLGRPDAPKIAVDNNSTRRLCGELVELMAVAAGSRSPFDFDLPTCQVYPPNVILMSSARNAMRGLANDDLGNLPGFGTLKSNVGNERV